MGEFGCCEAGAVMMNRVGLAIERASQSFGDRSKQFLDDRRDVVDPNMASSDITQEWVDDAWKKAVRCKLSYCKPVLSETELDIARFAAQALVRRYTEDSNPLESDSDSTGLGQTQIQTLDPVYAVSWAQFIDL